MTKQQSSIRKGLALVRQATGLSQAKFADALGINKTTIEGIEAGRVEELKDALANSIGALTGAVPWTIKSGNPLDLHEKPYSEHSYEQWRNLQFDDAEINELINMSREYITVLLSAAVQNTAGQRTSHIFRSMLIALNQFLFAQMNNHGLESRINALMEEKLSGDSDGEMNVKFARSYFKDSPQWQANDRHQWKPSAKVRITQRSIPQFIPFVGFWKSDAGPAFLNGRRKFRHIYDLEIEGHKFRIVEEKMHGRLDASESMLRETLKPSAKRKRKA